MQQGRGFWEKPPTLFAAALVRKRNPPRHRQRGWG